MKIQDITNMVLKQLRGGGRVIYFDSGDGYIWVTSDCVAAYRIPLYKVEFNLNRCEQNEALMNAVKEQDDHVYGALTGNMRYAYSTSKEICAELQSDSLPNVSVWIKQKYLKPFADPDIKIRGATDSVLVYEYTDSKPCGLIMPVWMGGTKEGEPNET